MPVNGYADFYYNKTHADDRARYPCHQVGLSAHTPRAMGMTTAALRYNSLARLSLILGYLLTLRDDQRGRSSLHNTILSWLFVVPLCLLCTYIVHRPARREGASRGRYIKLDTTDAVHDTEKRRDDAGWSAATPPGSQQ
jgi:hypothetical protein